MNPGKLFGRLNLQRACRIALVVAISAISASASAQNGASLDDTARLLAGLPVTGPLSAFTQDQRWQGHAAALDKAWKDISSSSAPTAKMRELIESVMSAPDVTFKYILVTGYLAKYINPKIHARAQLLTERPQLRYLLLHNIDTLGADVSPALLGHHIESGACLTFEVITRRLEDRGGGLARVNGRPRLVEGLAMPREEAEFALSYYNSNTCWIDLDQLLPTFGITRAGIADEARITSGIRSLASKMPTYVTLKEVKKRWGQGQEDVFPVAQFEKLWVDMTALPEVDSRFVVVPRLRGQQLKDQAQLDGWLRDGSAAFVEQLCEWR